MTKLSIFKSLIIHVVISLFVGMLLITFNNSEFLRDRGLMTSIIYIFETLLIIFLYLILSKKFLENLPKKIILNSISIILGMNLILGLSGYVMINFGSGIMVENGQLPILLLIIFNAGFNPLLSLSTLPNSLNLILLSFLSPLLIYLGARKSKILK